MAGPLSPNPLARLRDWLAFADYEAEKQEATRVTMARYARGNVTFQNGLVLDENDLDELSAQGDKALNRLRLIVPE